MVRRTRWSPGGWTGMAMAALFALASIGPGCDEQPRRSSSSDATTTPADDGNNAAAATAPAKPTTQQMLAAPRKTLVLGSLPLTVQAHPDWKLGTGESEGKARIWIEGPTPSTPTGVRMMIQPVSQIHSLRTIQLIEKDAAKDREKDPQTVLVSELRPVGRAYVLEKRSITHTRAMTVTDELFDVNTGTRRPVTRTIPAQAFVEWQLMVFTPEDKEYLPTLLAFPGLTLEQYEADREFLERMVRSLQYNAAPNAF